MVAITVTLAAVVGAFVIGIGGNMAQPAPTAVVEAADAPENLEQTADWDTGGGDGILHIEHRSGDELSHDNLKIVISHQSQNFTIRDSNFTESGVWVSGQGHTEAVVWKGSTSDGDFVIGEQYTLSEADGQDLPIPDGKYEVTLIHRPSNSIIDETLVVVE